MTDPAGALSLEGLQVVVTRPRRQARALGELLQGRGAVVLYLPVIDITDPESWDDVDRAVRTLAEGRYDWVVFASRNAVGRFMRRVRLARLGADAFVGARVAAVGPATAAMLRKHGVQPDLVPRTFSAAALAQELGTGHGAVLLPRVERGPPGVLEQLTARGWDVDEVATYRNVLARRDTPEAEAVRAGRFDVVSFASGSAARAFVAVVARPEALGLAADDPPDRQVACLGPKTARAAREAGFRVDIQAVDHTAEGLVEALVTARAAR